MPLNSSWSKGTLSYPQNSLLEFWFLQHFNILLYTLFWHFPIETNLFDRKSNLASLSFNLWNEKWLLLLKWHVLAPRNNAHLSLRTLISKLLSLTAYTSEKKRSKARYELLWMFPLFRVGQTWGHLRSEKAKLPKTYIFLRKWAKFVGLPGTGCFINNVTSSKRNISGNIACISTKLASYNLMFIRNKILNNHKKPLPQAITVATNLLSKFWWRHA